MPDALSPDVQNFITGHIRSIAQLELLLFLADKPARTMTVKEAAKELYTAEGMTLPLLESLRAIGLVSVDAGPEPRYAYAPKTPELAAVVANLAQAYRERRVTIINLIYSAPLEQLRNFSDAFRIRKQEDT
jgi:predicted transcriptional regulator